MDHHSSGLFTRGCARRGDRRTPAEKTPESGLERRFHTRFAGQRIAFFALFPVDQEDFQPFSPNLSPDRGDFWLNHQSVCFLPGSLPPSSIARRRALSVAPRPGRASNRPDVIANGTRKGNL